MNPSPCPTLLAPSRIVSYILPRVATGSIPAVLYDVMRSRGQLVSAVCRYRGSPLSSNDAHHEKTDLKVFVLAIPKEGWAHVAVPILLLV